MFTPLFAMLILAGSDAQTAAATGTAQTKEPERKVCQIYEQIGSRLGNRKICMTPTQWEEKRRTQRTEVERVQQVVGQGSSK